MAAGRRPKPPLPPRGKRRTSSSDSSSGPTLLSASAAALLFALCLCAFDFDHGRGIPRREAQCRATCDDRLQSAALESRAPSSLLSPDAPSAEEAPFLRRGAAPRDPFRGSGGRSAEARADDGARGARPRRLPALIRVLTGFDDRSGAHPPSSSSSPASSPGGRPVLARAERPAFLKESTRRRRRPPGAETEAEEYVRTAAAAAAAAVFSDATRIFGRNRMARVNSEWDAALRWIAGWESHPPPPSQRDPRRAPRGGGGAADASTGRGGATAGDPTPEGFDDFVDDLARMLEECIRQCAEGEGFEARLLADDAGSGEMSLGGSHMGNLAARSFLGWIAGSALPKPPFGKSMSPEVGLVLAKTLRLVASSLAVFGLCSLWSWASPTAADWYASLGYVESPEWLVEHERELERAKASSSARGRPKKKKRQQQQQQQHQQQQHQRRQPAAAGRGKASAKDDGARGDDKRTSGERNRGPARPAKSLRSTQESQERRADRSDDAVPAKPERQPSSDREEAAVPPVEVAVPDSKDSVSDTQASSTTEDVPSVISYPTVSTASSPSMKPIGSHLEHRDAPYGAPLPGPRRPVVLGFAPPPPAAANGGGGPAFSRALYHPTALPVPTQEQRNEAAKQLREYQDAQIQRLLLQRKLSSLTSSGSRLSGNRPSGAASPIGSGLVPGGSPENAPAMPLGQRRPVPRPPPGLAHPSEHAYNPDHHTQYDQAFLADNELLLSKLLDDDDDEDAPPAKDGRANATSPSSRSDGANEAWPSGASGLKEGSPVRIKGVYGGSVW
ncbi:hypothetical protein ACHAWF_010452 [Thalassiosira exigua]